MIDPRERDLTEAVFALSDAAIEHSIPALAPRRRIVVVGIHERPFDL